MGFQKRGDEKPRKKKRRDEEAGAGVYKGFKPSTAEDLKAYAKAARKRDKLRKKAKESRRVERVEPLQPIDGANLQKFVRIYAKIIGEKGASQLEESKSAKAKKVVVQWLWAVPQYDARQGRKLADSNFVYAVQGTLAGFNWKELRRLVKAALGEVPDECHTYTGTFKLVERLMHQALGVTPDADGVQYKLVDRDKTLSIWPAKPIEESKMSAKDKAALKKSKKLKKQAVEDESDGEEAAVVKKAKKKVKEDAEPKAKRAEKAAPPKLSDDSVVCKLKERPKGGPKTKLLNLLSRKGTPLKKIRSKAVEEGLPRDKVGPWLTIMAKNGFVGIE